MHFQCNNRSSRYAFYMCFPSLILIIFCNTVGRKINYHVYDAYNMNKYHSALPLHLKTISFAAVRERTSYNFSQGRNKHKYCQMSV